MSSVKVIYEGSEAEVIDRKTGKPCPKVYTSVTETTISEAYGAPCEVEIIKKKKKS